MRENLIAVFQSVGFVNNMREARKECPCVITGNICSYACTCSYPHMSGGCLYCPIYGSEEQKCKHAVYIQRTYETSVEFLLVAKETERLLKDLEVLYIPYFFPDETQQEVNSRIEEINQEHGNLLNYITYIKSQNRRLIAALENEEDVKITLDS